MAQWSWSEAEERVKDILVSEQNLSDEDARHVFIALMFTAIKDMLIRKGLITLDDWNAAIKEAFEEYIEGWEYHKRELYPGAQ